MCPKRGSGWGVHSNDRTTTERSPHFPTEVFFTLKTPIIFSKKRTLPFLRLPLDRTPLNPQKMDISAGAVEE